MEYLERSAALAALVVLSPILLAAAIAVFLCDSGPVIFRQRRIGKDGQPFELMKLRSMRVSQDGPDITSGGDPRVTPVGRVLRKHKVDELPQLWNVVRGDMLLIGPRPEIPRYVNIDDVLWRKVLAVKPGITDFASLLYHREEETLQGVDAPERHYREHILPHKLNLNIQYLEKRTLRSDFLLLASTAALSLFPARLDETRLRRLIFA
jgi:lipopolysaccharide/colanic/teichoic acid biosynthesis glycosyltransferase